MSNVRIGRRVAAGMIVAAAAWIALPAASATAAVPQAAAGDPSCSFVFPPLPGCHDQDAFTGTGWGFDHR